MPTDGKLLDSSETHEVVHPASAPSRFSAVETILLAQGRRLFSWLPVGWAIGALLYFFPPYEPGWHLAALIFGIGAALLAATWSRLRFRALAFTLLTLSGGFLDAEWSAHRLPPMPALPSRAVILHAHINRIDILPPRHGETPGRRLILQNAVFETGIDIGMPPLRRLLRVRLREDDITPLQAGQEIRLRALFRQPSWPSLPGGRDPQREAWFANIAGNGYALGPATALSPPTRQSLEKLREHVAATISQTLSGQRAAIAATLLAGESSGIDPRTRQDFAASGLAHLLAVAGLHLGLVMAFVIVSLRAALAAWPYAALRWPCREIAVLGGFGIGIGYVLLTGAHLPAVRSLGMAALATLALMTGRHVLSMRSLALIGLAILIVAPASVLDISFQMSFAAVMALIAGYEALRERLLDMRGEGGFLRLLISHIIALALTSLLAGAATLPISVAHFGNLQPWFVLANLLAVPLAAIWVMPSGVCALLLMPFHLAAPFLILMGWGIGIITTLAHAVAMLPYAENPVPAMPGWGLTLYLLALCVLCLWKGPPRLFALAPMALALIAPWLAAKPIVLVSPDAGLMAVRDQNHLELGPFGPLEDETRDEWVKALALPISSLLAHPGCTETACPVEHNGRKILLRLRDRQDGRILPSEEACRHAVLFVSASPAHGACPGAAVIDRFSVWRDGAYAVFATRQGLNLVSDRSTRGARLWVPKIGSHGMPNLPLAQEE
ncbi:ComEC/Rec2 family competence protein [Kozakia baliensis]|uniref:ComEC/Rec2 family competence protein n=1 Tax=Kozakia baliensis TaxID=153496 RepID=UPI000A495031|nr:ComEC/Rec2 family competence protein [Kozakia baliensis]